jgi:hypothetical protein
MEFEGTVPENVAGKLEISPISRPNMEEPKAVGMSDSILRSKSWTR